MLPSVLQHFQPELQQGATCASICSAAFPARITARSHLCFHLFCSISSQNYSKEPPVLPSVLQHFQPELQQGVSCASICSSALPARITARSHLCFHLFFGISSQNYSKESVMLPSVLQHFQPDLQQGVSCASICSSALSDRITARSQTHKIKSSINFLLIDIYGLHAHLQQYWTQTREVKILISSQSLIFLHYGYNLIFATQLYTQKRSV